MPRFHILYILSRTFQSLEKILESQRENIEREHCHFVSPRMYVWALASFVEEAAVTNRWAVCLVTGLVYTVKMCELL